MKALYFFAYIYRCAGDISRMACCISLLLFSPSATVLFLFSLGLSFFLSTIFRQIGISFHAWVHLSSPPPQALLKVYQMKQRFLVHSLIFLFSIVLGSISS
ncbi:hypothetical protein BJX99DRAFT_30252 [Aspergillus californicus]